MTKGMRFRRLDLHIHTPASACFIEPDVTPGMIVQQAIGAGMEAIAITDHHSGEWVDRVKAAAQGTSLVVFPGVEITVQPGVHIIALFPGDKTGAHVTDLLADLGIGKDQRGRREAMVTRYGIQRVLEIISREHGALAVLAHIDDHKGVWHELDGQTRIQIWQEGRYAAVEYAGGTLPSQIGQAPYTRRPAVYRASDNPHPDQPAKHSHRGIGTRHSRFKLDDPISLEGLRNCFNDPETRIQADPPPLGQEHDAAHPVLEWVEIAGGFLDGLELPLNPNQNCVIGGRGTGKSVLLETIRYAFGLEPKTDANRKQVETLFAPPSNDNPHPPFPPGSLIKVTSTRDGVRYRVERTAQRSPRVYRADTGEELTNVAPAALLPLEVYGQKEVYEISGDPAFQLRLLDNYVAEDLKEPLEEEETLLRQLKTNAGAILRLEEDVESVQERVDELAAVQEELRRMEQADFAARVEQKRRYDREQVLLSRAETWVAGLREQVQIFVEEHRLSPNLLSDEQLVGLPNQETLRAQRALLEAIDTDLQATLEQLGARLATRWAEGQPARGTWQEDYQEQDDAYQTLLRQFQAEGQEGFDFDRYIRLQARRSTLEQLAAEVERYRQEVARLEAERQTLLAQLRAIRRCQYEIRRDKADELSQHLRGRVRMTVHPQGYRAALEVYLRDLFAGRNVRSPARKQMSSIRADTPERAAQRPVKIRGETRYLIPEIPAYRDPIELAEAIRFEQRRTGDEPSLLEVHFGVDSAAMRRNASGLDRESLFNLETFSVPDLPVIELQVGSGELGYKPLEHISVGQRCTAILSLILLESNAPLLIDQPEDDLDNQFIFDQIVATLRREKEHRQFLIATHNANIPVSGDAELIIVLDADERHGQVVEGGLGCIDAPSIKQAVERLLEGGEEAFRIRKEKYGIR